MRVALVYDRINKIGGAEQVLIAFSDLYPDADWYTSVWEPKKAPFSRNWHIYTSWLSKIPFFRTHHELIPYLMPFVFESFDLSQYDLVISIGSAESKGIITRPGTIHLNYCLTPTRYLYSHQNSYLSNPIYRFIGNYLRKWDLVASTRPDEMIAISTQVKKRIKDVYKRDSDIIFPPVDTQRFKKKSAFMPTYSDYYLTVARLVPYKKIDVLVKAFNQNGKTLIIVGEGSEMYNLTRLAKDNIHLVGSVSDDELVGYYQHAKAFLHAGEEDFGISMCEAQSSGVPVIAYAKGGAADIVKNKKTGILIEQASAGAIVQAVDMFETMNFDKAVCQSNAERFNKSLWATKITERIRQICLNN
jgi:glycosyltransferase involved in cell wall biosynthesis